MECSNRECRKPVACSLKVIRKKPRPRKKKVEDVEKGEGASPEVNQQQKASNGEQSKPKVEQPPAGEDGREQGVENVATPTQTDGNNVPTATD